MSVDAILLDLDDTLYAYEPCNEAGKDAAWRTARERGYDLDREAFDELYREGRRATKREVPLTAAAHERFLYFERALYDVVGTHRASDALALGEAYWGGYVDAMEPFPGVEETLAALSDRGVDVAVVTNLTTQIQLRKIDALGLEPSVDLLVTSEAVGREKPAAAPFTYALARLDRRPSETLMVGNSVAKDVVGANALGIETVLFNPNTTERLEGLRAPDHRIDSFGELTKLV